MSMPSDAFVQALAANDYATVEKCAREIIATRSDHPPTWQALGEAQLNQGRATEAIESLQQALSLGGDGAILRFELASAFEQCDRVDEAVSHLQRAVALDPQMAAAHINLAALLEKLDRLDEALAIARRAIDVSPGHPVAYYNLGTVLKSLGQLNEAITAYSKAVEIDKQFAVAYTNRGWCRLLMGDYSAGWVDYEWRLATEHVQTTRYSQPRWNGKPLHSGTLLVHGEQGIGDEIQFASCLPEVVPLVNRCVLVCDPRLSKLMARSFPALTVVAHDRQADPAPPKLPMNVDVQVPSGSLPMHLRSSIECFPGRKRFLLADPAQKCLWRKRFEVLGPGLKIGISWRGGGTWEERRKRTTTLNQWSDVLGMTGVQFINLQYGDVTGEIDALRQQTGAVIHQFDDADPLGDLDAFAAKVAALDLVISVGNATVHLAGALGVPCWCLVPAVPQWRWSIRGETTPWYPSVRIIRQNRPDDWNSAIAEAVSHLREFIQIGPPKPRDVATTNGHIAPGKATDPVQVKRAESASKPGNTAPPGVAHARPHDRNVDAKQVAQKAVSLFNENRFEEAIPLAEQLLAADADSIVALRILGVAARKSQMLDRSLQLLSRAVKIAPNNAPLHFELGVTYTELKQQREAYECFLKCIQNNPAFQPACVNIAAILEQQERYEESLPWARKAVELKPDCPLANYNCANQLRECGRVAEAIPHYQRALALKPDYVKAKWNLGICHLLLGDYAAGWPLFEVREIADEVKVDKFTQPRWDGSSLAGKTIVVHAEQGLGDEVLFASCFGDVISRAAKTILICEPRLLKLFKRSFPQATIYSWTRRRDWSPIPLVEAVDWQIPAGSLPMYFRTTAENFPLRKEFLTADPVNIGAWRSRFAKLDAGLKVGLSWRAGGKANEGRKRTISLLDWRDILTTPGVQFVNLQYGDVSEDVAETRRELGVTVHDWEEGDPLVDIDGYAAKIAALDLVISVGNAAVHLAGALDVPAWTMLPRVPSWRWMVTGDVSPWYASVRLFRQPRRSQWQPVLDQIALRLREASEKWASGASLDEVETCIRAVMPQNVLPDASPIAPPATPCDRWLDAKDLGCRQPQQVIVMLEEQAEAARAQGNLIEAERFYREILQITPRQMKAHVGLGSIARQTGRMDLAIRSLQRALTMFEPHAANHAQLAQMLLDVGRNDEALVHAQRAVELDAKLPMAQQELAQALQATGQRTDAKKSLGRIVQKTSANIMEICTHARKLAINGGLDAALDILRGAIEKLPNEAYLHVALGELFMEDQLLDDAQHCFLKAIELAPALADAHYQIARLLEQRGLADEAIAAGRTALEHAPKHLAAILLLAKLLRQSSAAAEAEVLYRRAIELRGESPELCNLLGVTLAEQGHLDEAISQYDRALKLQLDHAPSHANRALSLLKLGRFAEGWDEYEYRWRSGQQDRFAMKFSQPIWDGAPLAGKSIAIYGEQGVGDEIMFATCYPDAIQNARQCIMICDTRLERLFRRSFPQSLVLGVPRGNEHLWKLPTALSIDVQAAAGSTPRYLRRQLSHFPRQRQLLIPDAASTAQWRLRFAALGPGKKIGISWRTSETARDFNRRSTLLSHWQSLFSLPDICWVNLQYGDYRAELADAAAGQGVTIHDPAPTDHQFDLDGLAAKIAALDLVITVDNTTAHLAGAVGTPTWIALPEPADWRWLTNRDDSIWYAMVRLFRQNRSQRWEEVFQQMQEELLKPAWRLDEKSNKGLAACGPHWLQMRTGHKVN